MGKTRVKDTSGFLWTEEGERRRGMIAEVAPMIPVDRTYSFAVPDDLAESVSPGQRVVVGMGRKGRPVKAFIVGLDHGDWDATLRPIDSLVDETSYLTPELLRIGREISEHYACPLGQALKALTPESVRRRRGLKTVRYARLTRPVTEIEAAGRLGPKQRAVLETLSNARDAMPVSVLLGKAGASQAVLRSAVSNGWIAIEARKEEREEAEPADIPRQDFDFILNEAQQAAFDAVVRDIEAGRFCVSLLFGVSGGGKTEVYIRAMKHVLARGRQALLLVPEIMLTTQLVQRLAARFDHAAVMHSGLTEAQRSMEWHRVAEGRAAVVVGTRSAVFAPFPNLGLICVDEEQETSYKNLQAPRFHTRDVAILRARNLAIPILLGSATPSVETWYHSEHRPDYRRLLIRRRIAERPMPKVHIIDMNEEQVELKRNVVLSRTLERLLGETLGRGEQALLLMNRRGFAHRLYCPNCRMRVACPNCNVGLVVHTSINQCVCHFCGTRVPVPRLCPNVTCSEELVPVGVGTQKVEDVVSRRFPEARMYRVDSDTMKHRRQYRRVLEQFESRQIDVLIGTQMIAKGLDFPFVSLVGVVHADSAALTADFRAHERLFQLITQVAGRAGRGDAPGQVVVQTTSPSLPALRSALAHDYEGFVCAELPLRHRFGLPPFRRLARLLLAHPREETARKEAEALTERILAAIQSMQLPQADVLGPNPCVLPRLRGRYRYHLLVRTANASDLRSLLRNLRSDGGLRSKARSITIDVDPVDMT